MNAKRQRFIEAYVGEAAGNAAEAARIAGYSSKSARQTGCELLTDPNIQAAVQSKAADLAAKTEATAERILSEVSDVAFTKIKVKGGDKLKALELLGRYRKLWQDKAGDSANRIQVNIGFLSTSAVAALPQSVVIETHSQSQLTQGADMNNGMIGPALVPARNRLT